jgi:hypothetical protein
MLIAGAAIVGFAIAMLTDIERTSGNQLGRKVMWVILWLGFVFILLFTDPSLGALLSAIIGSFAGLGVRRWLRRRAATTRTDSP